MKRTVPSLLATIAFTIIVGVIARPHAQDRSSQVAQAKAELVAQGVDLSGACGAFRITQLFAWKNRPQYGFLAKGAGNRAIPQPDGTCLDGDHGGGVGYATDYVIDRLTFFGFDLLGDGGGANVPQFMGPETDAEMVTRNQRNFTEAFEPPHPPVVTPPTPPTPPAPSGPDPVVLGQRIDALEHALAGQHTPKGCKSAVFGFPVHCELTY